MLVLDENLPAAQRLLLRRWRIHFRVVGLDLAAWGTDDENLIPALHRLPQPTFLASIVNSVALIGRTRVTAWFGWTWRMTGRPNSSAGSCGIRPLIPKPSEWAR